MDGLPFPRHQISISCNDNKNDGATQTINGINIQNVNKYYPVAPPTSPVPSRAPFPTQNYVAGKVSHNTQVVLTWLKDLSFHPIGVWGMGGVGKTKLLEAIFNKLYADPNIAGSIYWVNVSQSCSLYQLQEKIAQAIRFNFHGNDTERIRAALLHQKLHDMKRVVLILDDVWDCFQVEEIEIPRWENGCKIIISTRDKTLCKRMGCAEYVLQVQPLTEGEALKLFRSTLENYDKLSDDVQKIADLVSKECHCLPLAIKVIAASLKGEYDFYKWEYALYQLRNLDRGHEDMEKKVLGKLRISYDRLKGEELKSCFLNCVLYPEDYKFKREELIDLLIMEGSLDYIKERAMRLTRGHIILDELVNSCMLEPCIDFSSKIWGVKMHDLMREMAINITTKDPRFLAKSGLHMKKMPDKEHWNKILVKVSLSHNRIRAVPCDLSPETLNLTVLFFNANPLLEITELFFVRMKSLKVLNLSQTKIERLPESVGDLKDLRALFLNACEKLKYVPSVAKLINLRELILPFPCYKEPWDLEEMTRSMEKLKNLEKVGYCQWKTSDVIYFNSFIKSSHSLTHYFLVLADEELDVREFFDASVVEDREYDGSIFIIGRKFGDDKPIPIIPCTAEWVCIAHMDIKREIYLVNVLPSLYDVKKLKYLEVHYCKGLEYIATSTVQGHYFSFSQLEILEDLTLEKLPDLARMTQYGAFCFSNLKWLTILGCPRMVVGIPIKSAHHTLSVLPNLTYINVCDCEEMKEIFETSDISSSSSETNVTNYVPILTLPKLVWLSLHNLPKLGRIYRGLLHCPSLATMDTEISLCPELNLLWLSKSLVCNGWASRASIPMQEDSSEWWEPLLKNYPKDADTLFKFKALGEVNYNTDEKEDAHSHLSGVHHSEEDPNEPDDEDSDRGNFLCAAVNAVLRAVAHLCSGMC